MFQIKLYKKLYLSMLSCMIFFNAVTIKSEVEYAQLGKDIALAYGTYLLGTIAHEFGHWLVGKIIHKCNGVFYIRPDGSGVTYLYYNPTREVVKALWNDNKYYHFKQPRPINAFVDAAGPLFGIAFCALVPILNTFYHEYKKDRSIVNAFKRTMQQPYINDKQNVGLLAGALFSLRADILSLSPFKNGNDGNEILKYFNIHCPPDELAENILRRITSGISGYILGRILVLRYLNKSLPG